MCFEYILGQWHNCGDGNVRVVMETVAYVGLVKNGNGNVMGKLEIVEVFFRWIQGWWCNVIYMRVVIGLDKRVEVWGNGDSGLLCHRYYGNNSRACVMFS